MRWHDRRWTIVVFTAVLLASCSTKPTASSTTVTEAPPASVTPSSTEPRPAATTDPTSSPASGTSPRAARAVVTVSGGALPTETTAAYKAGGGDLVDPVEWRGRFGTSSVPELSGPGVRLVEATRRRELVAGRWTGTDEMSWLAMSTAGRDTVLGDMAAAVGLNERPSTSTSTDQAAECAVNTYAADTNGVEWRIQGCSYLRIPRMISIGVSRTGPADQAGGALDPTVNVVADALGGQVSFSEVTLGEPAADGSTLRMTVHLATNVDVATASERLDEGDLLSGWQSFPGDASLLLSGPTGATWTLSDRVGVYTWAGRW